MAVLEYILILLVVSSCVYFSYRMLTIVEENNSYYESLCEKIDRVKRLARIEMNEEQYC